VPQRRPGMYISSSTSLASGATQPDLRAGYRGRVRGSARRSTVDNPAPCGQRALLPPRAHAEKRFAALISTLLVLPLGACDSSSVLGYDDPRGYDDATMKLVFSMAPGQCLNRFTYDSKLAPSRPGIVSCESPAARIRNDGSHANTAGCQRLDDESITRDRRAFYCLEYLVRVGYCYPAVTRPSGEPVVLLYAPSACDESLPEPQVAADLVPGNGAKFPDSEFSTYVVNDIQSPAQGKRCASVSVDLEPPEEISGPGVPPATSQLVCLAAD
jgi:hypothetical protein